MTHPNTIHQLPLNHQKGMSLIELMVALAISLLLVLGLVNLVINSNRNFQELSMTGQQLENGRYAWQLLREDLRLAGFYGELFSLPAPAAALPNPCVVNDIPAQRQGMAFPIQAYDAPAATPLACLAVANYVPGTDVLVVRRASTSDTVQAGRLHIQATPAQFILDQVPSSGDLSAFDLTWFDTTNPPPVRPYLVHIYFISPFSVTAGAAGDGIPTLKRIEVGATGTTIVPLVEGIENMQFVFGLDTNGDGNPNSQLTNITSVDDWTNVVTVQVNLLVRNLQPSIGHTDSKSYVLGDVTVNPLNKAFKRHVYTASVRLTNPAGRRE